MRTFRVKNIIFQKGKYLVEGTQKLAKSQLVSFNRVPRSKQRLYEQIAQKLNNIYGKKALRFTVEEIEPIELDAPLPTMPPEDCHEDPNHGVDCHEVLHALEGIHSKISHEKFIELENQILKLIVDYSLEEFGDEPVDITPNDIEIEQEF